MVGNGSAPARPGESAAPHRADPADQSGGGYTIAAHLALVEQALVTHPWWERGTAHMNVLDQAAPDIAAIARGKVFDPTLWPGAEPQFVEWLSRLLASPVGQSMLAPVA